MAGNTSQRMILRPCWSDVRELLEKETGSNCRDQISLMENGIEHMEPNAMMTEANFASRTMMFELSTTLRKRCSGSMYVEEL